MYNQSNHYTNISSAMTVHSGLVLSNVISYFISMKIFVSEHINIKIKNRFS